MWYDAFHFVVIVTVSLHITYLPLPPVVLCLMFGIWSRIVGLIHTAARALVGMADAMSSCSNPHLYLLKTEQLANDGHDSMKKPSSFVKGLSRPSYGVTYQRIDE